LPDDAPMYEGSDHLFRSVWNRILATLLVPKSMGFTPACTRAGGAVHHFRQGMPIQDLMWKMRVTSQSTLSHYLQEVVALTSLKKLPDLSKHRILLFSRMYQLALKNVIDS